MDRKKTALFLIVTGCLALVGAILFAFAVGGPVVPVLTIASVTLNTVGIMITKGK